MALSKEERRRRKNAARNLKYATDPAYAKQQAEKSARYRAEHPDKAKACKANHYQKNKVELRAKQKAKRALNPGPHRASSKAYARDNADKVREAAKIYRSKNAERIKEQKAASYLENREAIRVKGLIYYAKNADKIKARTRAWEKANRARKNATEAVWRAANPEKAKARSARWQAKNPGAGRVRKHNRLAREKANGGKLSRDIAAKLMILQKGKCPVCRDDLRESGYHLDHIVPLALGGPNDDKNVQLLCPPCNQAKHAKPPIEFMQSRGFLL